MNLVADVIGQAFSELLIVTLLNQLTMTILYLSKVIQFE